MFTLYSLELVVPPDLQYGTKLENGSWTGIMALIAAKVSFMQYRDTEHLEIRENVHNLSTGREITFHLWLCMQEVDMTGVPIRVNTDRSSVVDPGFPLMAELMLLAHLKPLQSSDLAGFIKPFTLQVLCQD